MIQESSLKENNTNFLIQDEINFKSLFKYFVRNKFLIGSSSLIFSLFFLIVSYTLKRQWEGQFQIVLKEEKSVSELGRLESKLSKTDLFDLSQNNSLKTEVGILKSPSLLMPIFEYVNAYKLKINPKKKLYFSKWEDNLKIGLQKDTSILNISYKDNDKDLIKSVLSMMTNSYQEYSGKDKKRMEKLTRDYL